MKQAIPLLSVLFLSSCATTNSAPKPVERTVMQKTFDGQYGHESMGSTWSKYYKAAVDAGCTENYVHSLYVKPVSIECYSGALGDYKPSW